MRRPSTGLDGHKQEEDAGDDLQYDQENLQDEIVSVSSDQDVCEVSSQGADPPPFSTRGRNHLNEEITSPPIPTGIGERYSQTRSNLGHAALLRRCELPV
jgi:hypothetical protein